MKEEKLLIGLNNIEGYVTSQVDIKEGDDIFWRAYVLYPVVNVDKDHVTLITELDAVDAGRIVDREDFDNVVSDSAAKFIKAEKVNAIARFVA